MTKRTEEKRGMEPRETFFLNVMQGYADGSLDPLNDNESVSSSLEEAVNDASQSVDNHDGVVWIYECRPVRRVRRHSVVVEEVTAD